MFGAVSNRDLEEIDKYFQQLIEFLSYEKSEFEYVESTGNKKVDDMFKNWNQQIKKFDKRTKDDMRVLGEIVLTADKVEQGIYKCRIKGDSDNPTISTLRNTLNKMLISIDDATSRISKVVTSYTNDDFTDYIKVVDNYKDDMKLLMESINLLGKELGSSAKNNFQNGETLENSASTMTNSMNNLAEKANEQAASLEETAAALEEITSITRNNTQNATKMATLGQVVKKSVLSGEELASKTASSMDEINEKVKAINSAITVIDQIAFQTNILSLNAAVEAATAGEAGKGFAVVAQEVRNLATRSAEAAREIKAIVENATKKADLGKKISEDMISGYKTLNEDIIKTIDLIKGVESSSKEQLAGIEQINHAINSLDQQTQQNAQIASQTYSVAMQTDTIAKLIVSNANSKEFIGKNEVKAKTLDEDNQNKIVLDIKKPNLKEDKEE